MSVINHILVQIVNWLSGNGSCSLPFGSQKLRGGADKSLARPGRKKATATKLGIYSTYSPRSSIQPPFSLCNKKRLAIRHMNRPLFPTTLSIPSYDIVKKDGLRTYQHPLVTLYGTDHRTVVWGSRTLVDFTHEVKVFPIRTMEA